MKHFNIQTGSTLADERYRIVINAKGPYLVYGRPPFRQQIILPDEEGNSWTFQNGSRFSTEQEPTALCRCGRSSHKPYCDGTHSRVAWDFELLTPEHPLLGGAKQYVGANLTLTDNEAYCVFARFCDARGRIWNLVERSDDPLAAELTVREANLCPGGRLSAWDNESGKPFEPQYVPSLALIEDPSLKVSGGLWVRGGIPVEREDGYVYEVRNRMVLCRCGASSRKPFCDGSHVSARFRDELALPEEKK